MVNLMEGFTGDGWAEEYDRRIKLIRESRWSLGFKDRGLGHGDFGVLYKLDGEDRLLLECDGRELAEYLIEMHNNEVPVSQKPEPPKNVLIRNNRTKAKR